jgi:hypothetical protein
MGCIVVGALGLIPTTRDAQVVEAGVADVVGRRRPFRVAFLSAAEDQGLTQQNREIRRCTSAVREHAPLETGSNLETGTRCQATQRHLFPDQIDH